MDNFNLKKYLKSNLLLIEGQFSWFTQDTNQQIGSDEENTLPFVYMHDDKGNKWLEKRYEGYGEFGGKDYYELLDQMNGGSGDRSEGISKAFNVALKGKIKFPALTVSATLPAGHNFYEEAENDPNQSWYTPEDDDDDEYISWRDEEDDEYLDESKIEEEKPKTKMKKSELKEMIRKAMMEDTGAAVTDKMYDPVSEAEEEETDTEDTETTDTEVTDTETTDTETTDTETTEEDPKLTLNDIQQNLEDALEAAKKLGDEKLIDQIGNTITFFTRTHVSSGGEALQEAEIRRWQVRAGIIK